MLKEQMKVKLLIAVIFIVTLVMLNANSHPDSKNNGKDSPRFYGGVKRHPEHP